MKITLKELKSLIRESVKSELENLHSEPFVGATGEKSTKEPKYIDFVREIFKKYRSNPYNFKNDEGKPFFAIYGNDKKAAIEELVYKLDLTKEQEEELLNPRGYIATFFFGTTFSIKLENLAALAKMAEDELGIDLETVESSGSIDELKEAELIGLGLSEVVAKALVEKFPRASSEKLKSLGEKLIRFDSEPKAQKELLDLILTGNENTINRSIDNWVRDRERKMRDRQRRAERRRNEI